MDGARLPVEAWFWETPVCTRWWTTATLLASALVQCRIVSPYQLFYSYRAVFHRSQVMCSEIVSRGLSLTPLRSTGASSRRSSTLVRSRSICSSTSTSSSDTRAFSKNHPAGPQLTFLGFCSTPWSASSSCLPSSPCLSSGIRFLRLSYIFGPGKTQTRSSASSAFLSSPLRTCRGY